MVQSLYIWTLVAVFSPLVGALIAGLAGRRLARGLVHALTIGLVSLSFISSVVLAYGVLNQGENLYINLYTWAISGPANCHIGFMIDRLSVIMMLLVTFVSLIVHIYSIGYMAEEQQDARFFAYVSLFTVAMLLLVTANNFFQLFVGWEGVGLVSYLLIGYWFEKPSAAAGGLKAFIVNRVGDLGFILGIAAVIAYAGSLDYQEVFFAAPAISTQHMTWICLLLFIGAMGKSAQMPLHVWLPESMEGPTPISALIHAATMVTAGIFMVARLSPLFELSPVALNVVLIIGATGALLTGLLAFVEFDIKRIIAFSTMSQLGYMMAADGASQYSAGIYHLVNHGCFKALLFLAAGSIIIALHHEQDLRKMGNLRKYLPITHLCFLIGALSLAGIPPFSGFFSKESILTAVHLSTLPAAHYAYGCLLAGVFVTAYYIFRAYFMAFYNSGHDLTHNTGFKISEPTRFITWPLILLAIPSAALGYLSYQAFIGDLPNILGSSIIQNNAIVMHMSEEFANAASMCLAAWKAPAFWLALAGIFCAWLVVLVYPAQREKLAKKFTWLNFLLKQQYGFDALNNWLFVRGTQKLSHFFYHNADLKLIDHYMVDGTGRQVSRISRFMRLMQSGYLYHYAFAMIIGLLVFLFWLIIK